MKLKIPNDKTKQKTKLNWGLLLLTAIGVGSYLWDKAKKKKLAEAQAKTYRDRLLPPVKEQITLPAETGSAESRLRVLGINTSAPSQYQASGENYKEI